MSPEHYHGEFTTQLDKGEIELIAKGIPQLTSITWHAVGNLEDYDKDYDEVTIYNNNDESTGVKITHGLYGEPQPLGGRKGMGYEQLHKLSIGEEYVEVLLNPDGSIKGIKPNIHAKEPYSVHNWLRTAYLVINNMYDNPFYYYFRR